jgi:hypothetical protein
MFTKRAVFAMALSIALLGTTAVAEWIGPIEAPMIRGNVLETPAADVLMDLSMMDFGERGNSAWGLSHRHQFQVGGFDVDIENLEFDPDPFIVVSFSATNTGTTTQTLSLSITQPGGLLSPGLMSGSVTTQIIDATHPGDGATASAPLAGSVYTALIDGVAVQALQDYPFSISAPAGGINSAGASFGPNGCGAVTSDIGIDIALTISPGDMGQVLARFDVVIPEPMTLSVLALGGLALLRRRR